MHLWTFQVSEALTSLNTDRVLYGPPEHAEFPKAYEWMLEQMQERLPAFTGKHPVWAWTKKPDLRRERWQWEGIWHLIEFEAPEDKCLVSDYDAWHDVLNGFAHHTQHEFDCWEDRWKNPNYRDECLRTWPRIFDLEFWKRDPKWFGGPPVLQVTVDGLRLEWVKSIRSFVGPAKKGAS